MTQFTEGQEVSIVNGRDVVAMTTVRKVGKLKMTLTNGEEWRADGRRRWGTYDHWSTHYIRERQPDDAVSYRRSRDLHLVQSFGNWHRMIDEDLHTVAEAIRSDRQRRIAEAAAVADRAEVTK